MSDVFPRRNLPPEAEEWGREVEERYFQIENLISGLGQSFAGLDRSSTSIQDNLGLQIRQVMNLYNALPVTRQGRASVSGFGVPTGWNTVASTTIPFVEAGTFSLAATASGQLARSDSGLQTCSFRLQLSSGQTSPEVPGAFAFSGGAGVNNFLVNYGWTVPVSAGTNLTVSLQANPSEAWPGGTTSYAVLTAFGTFTRN